MKRISFQITTTKSIISSAINHAPGGLLCAVNWYFMYTFVNYYHKKVAEVEFILAFIVILVRIYSREFSYSKGISQTSRYF